MKELKIYYSIGNGGDGSAYLKYMESEKLADWDQEHMYEGWAESCCGVMEFQSNSEISTNLNIITKEDYLFDRYLRLWDTISDETIEFVNEFFPDGLPEFLDKTETEIKNKIKELRDALER